MSGVNLAALNQPQIVTIKVAGVSVQARAFRHGDLVHLEFMLDTPMGPVAGQLQTDIPTFEKMAEAAEKHDILPRAKRLVEYYTGQRLILAR